MVAESFSNAALDGCRVLIVEDDSLIAAALEDIIEDLGCTLAGSAASVAEALPLVKAGAFDVALIDLHLGSELALPVAAAARAAGKPFAFTSGASEIPTDFADAVSVAKPYRLDGVARGLHTALERSATTA